MKRSSDGRNHFGLKTDFQRGIVFSVLSAAIFAILTLVERPHWAGPWLIASMFTFAVWRLSRQQSKSAPRRS